MTTQRKFGQPGKQPIWEWDWPWHRLGDVSPYSGYSGKFTPTTAPNWRPSFTPAVSGNVTGIKPTDWFGLGAGKPPAFTPATTPTTPVVAPETTTTTGKNGWFFEKNFQESGQDMWVCYENGVVTDLKEIPTSQSTNIQSLPIQAQWQLQELARTRKVLGIEPNPYWLPVERSIESRLATGDITEEDIAMLDRARQTEILSKGQEVEAQGNVMAERLKQSSQWEMDKKKLLAGLPTGPEGDVARWFVQNRESPYRMLGRVGTEPSASEQGKQPKGPSAPSWLPEFAPGTEAGQPIGGYGYPYGRASWEMNAPEGTGKMPFVPTPSGQQLTKMTPSQAQWLAGAISHYGGRSWQDILTEAESMQPVTPRGAGKRQWRPPTQRVAV